MNRIDAFEALLARGQDTALLRFGLGQACFEADDAARAVTHLAAAVRLAPDYSAAWKLYGKALAQVGRAEDAIEAYARGIAVAEARGDIQAAKEMRVFRRRLLKQRS